MNATMKSLCTGALLVLLPAAGLAAAGDFRLAEAVKRGDREAVRSLLQDRADVNELLGDGSSPLAWAAHRNDLETAELLIRAGANPSAANDYGVTPLALGCTNRNAAMVQKLLQAGANPNAAQGSGETVLMTCARTGTVDGVKALLARGANPNARETQRGQTALMWAVAAKHPEVTRALIEGGADVNARSRVLDLFPAKRVDFYGDVHYAASKGGFTPLMFAARVGDAASARILLAAGAKVNDSTPEDGTALVVASASGQEEAAIVLLENGADPNAADAIGATALHWAVREGFQALSGNLQSGETDRFWRRPNMPGLAKALLDHGADPNARVRQEFHPYNTPLHSHNMGNSLPQISIVGATPFLLAAASGDVAIMRTLVERRADARVATAEGATPLMVAAGVGAELRYRKEQKENKKDFLEAARLALQLGGDIKATGGGGRSVLHGAAFHGEHEMIEFLVKNGADPDAKDQYGQTPLTIALGDPEGLAYRKRGDGRYDDRFRVITREDKATAELLLKLGASPFTGQYKPRGLGE